MQPQTGQHICESTTGKSPAQLILLRVEALGGRGEAAVEEPHEKIDE